ncbi:MAG TPA: hypothetical protein VKM56_07945 [Verrucomicrobiae bacterium]|nr:hypothetical protein [Verrucomicrobiae bacterium]
MSPEFSSLSFLTWSRCFHIFLAKGAGLVGLPLLVAALSMFLLWTERAAFSRLLPDTK